MAVELVVGTALSVLAGNVVFELESRISGLALKTAAAPAATIILAGPTASVVASTPASCIIIAALTI